MKWNRGLLLAGLVGLMVVPVGAQPDLIPGQFVPGSVTPLPGNPPAQGTLTAGVAKKTGLTEQQVGAVLKELGPLVADRLARGEGFEIQGVGSFRVIRVVSHRALVGTVAVEVPARNTVEFVPSGSFNATLNRPGAVPGVVVGLPDFNPQPDRVIPARATPSKIPSTRTPGSREQ